jgi:hypothetical protein
MSSVYKKPFAKAEATFWGGIPAGVPNEAMGEADRFPSSCIPGGSCPLPLPRTHFIRPGGKE